MDPERMEFHIGVTIHGQPLRLARQRTTGGQWEWVLYRDEGDQRDDRVFIAGLTSQNIQQMAEAIKQRP